MATYVALIRFTEQGAKNIRDTQRRAGAFRDAAKQAGVTVREVYWTMGTYDGLLIFDAPDEQAATAVMIDLGDAGLEFLAPDDEGHEVCLRIYRKMKPPIAFWNTRSHPCGP